MKGNISGLLLAVILAGAPAAGLAKAGDSPFYVGAGALYGFENFNEADAGPFSFSADNSPGLNFKGGYHFHPHFAVEAALDYYTGFDITLAGIGGDIDLLNLSFNLKYFPIAHPQQLRPYLLAGLGFGRAEAELQGLPSSVDGSGGTFQVGAGVDLQLTPRWGLYGETSYMLTFGDVSDLDVIRLAAGVLLFFGAPL